MRLSAGTAGRLPADVAQLDYDRRAQAVGIVHIGIGAFHRAHQAWYTNAAMNGGDPDWAITGISLRSAAVAQQMNPQDGLYTLAERSEKGTDVRLMGAIRNVLVASENPAAVTDALAAPETHIVSFTVTEKGYCRSADGELDGALANDRSFYPYLERALRRRRSAGLPGLTLLSCDNLAGNGGQIKALIRAYLSRTSADLIAWFEAECRCPATMVDRIVPATTDNDRADIQARLGGLRDEAAVVTEPFSQWVIEDDFAGPRPNWAMAGAELVDDVAPYETAKLRMLNGAHSALAYLGLAAGYRYVHEAIVDPDIRPVVERLMREEAAPTIAQTAGQDLNGYADALIDRFGNPALQHRLGQIAMDGSQKIPQRWLETLSANADRGQPCPALLTALSAWLRHLRGDNGPVDDPMGDTLVGLWRTTDAAGVAAALFGARGMFSAHWQAGDTELARLAQN